MEVTHKQTKEIIMARIKGGIKKREEETVYEKAMKKFKSIRETKGTISEKEMELFEKLLSKRNR